MILYTTNCCLTHPKILKGKWCITPSPVVFQVTQAYNKKYTGRKTSLAVWMRVKRGKGLLWVCCHAAKCCSDPSYHKHSHTLKGAASAFNIMKTDFCAFAPARQKCASNVRLRRSAFSKAAVSLPISISQNPAFGSPIVCLPPCIHYLVFHPAQAAHGFCFNSRVLQ